MPEDTSQFDQEFEILKCMYPELEVIEDNEQNLEAQLEFTVAPANSIKVLWRPTEVINTRIEEFDMPNFPGNVMWIKCHKASYPGGEKCVDYKLYSEWMTLDDRNRLRIAVDAELSNSSLNDHPDSFDEEFPLLTMLFDCVINSSPFALFDDTMYRCNTRGQFDLLKKLNHKSLQKEFEAQRLDCSICLGTKKGTEMVKLPCNEHLLCKACLHSYYSTMIKEGRISNVKCPECPFVEIEMSKIASYKQLKESLMTPSIPFEYFERYLSEDLCERYKKLFYEQAFVALYQQCPNSCAMCPRCNTWASKEDLDDELVVCPSCEFPFCANCLHSWHGNVNACRPTSIENDIVEEFSSEETSEQRKKEIEMKYGRKSMKLAADLLLAEKLLELAIQDKDSNMKRCPVCRTVIQKSDGCNKMQCTLCRKNFCFLCGDELDNDDPYYHFRYPASDCYARLFDGMPGTEVDFED